MTSCVSRYHSIADIQFSSRPTENHTCPPLVSDFRPPLTPVTRKHANRVHPTPTDADNSSGSLPAACNDWGIGDAVSTSVTPKRFAQVRIDSLRCKRATAPSTPSFWSAPKVAGGSYWMALVAFDIPLY